MTETDPSALTVTEQLEAFDTAMRRSANQQQSLLWRASTPTRSGATDAVWCRVHRGHLELVNLETMTSEMVNDDDALCELFSTDTPVVFASVKDAAAVAAHISERARDCQVKETSRLLWELWRWVRWVTTAAPGVTLTTCILTRALARTFWCGDPDLNRIEPWWKAAGISANISRASKVAKLYQMLPVPNADSGAGTTNHAVNAAVMSAIKSENQVRNGCSWFQQAGEAMMFSATERLVDVWDALDGLDEDMRARNLIAGTALPSAGEPDVWGEGEGQLSLAVAGAATWRDGTDVMLTRRSGTQELSARATLVSASPWVDGEQVLQLGASSAKGAAAVDALCAGAGEVLVSVAAPAYFFPKSAGMSKWYNGGYRKEAALFREVPLDVLLAGL